MQLGRRSYEERKESRIARMRARAEAKMAAGEATVALANKRADVIPFGQPILVGHHSEGRDRRYREKIRSGFVKGFETMNAGRELARRADAAEENEAISSDDPEAIDKLRAKLVALEAARAKMIAANKAVRSKTPELSLGRLGYSDALVTELLTPDFAGRKGFPDYRIRNSAAEALRLRKRIAALETKASAAPKEPERFGDITIEESDNRVRIVFPGKPNAEMRARLKASGFRWAPSENGWQRHASDHAWYEARRIVKLGSGQ